MEAIIKGLRLTPYGGAGQVTGSNFLVEGARGKILIDCGIEQGKDYCESCSFDDFPYDVPSIDALVITHAHLDHVGRAPRLMKYGFKGKVYMTAPTRDLAELIMRDSAHILLQAAQKNGLGPLYDDADVDAFLARVETLKYHEEREAAPGLSIVLRDTGHILGSASVRVKADDGTTLAVTSDIGASPAILLPDAEPVTDADVILIESVYGDRQNPERAHRVEILRDTLKRAIARGGTILMPSFSIERTQLMLYEIGTMMEKGELPTIPVYLDSPLAINVTAVYKKWGKDYFNQDAKEAVSETHDLFSFPFLKFTKDREESELIARAENPKLIIAGAGMSHGGRIGKWEKMYLPDPESTLIMVGYQAPGSPGRLMQDGAKKVVIDGHEVKLRAKVEVLHGWSGHADRDGLVAYADSCTNANTFLVGLGEPASSRFLAQRIHEFLGKRALVLAKGEAVDIEKGSVKRAVA